jgi:hypothetical protein
MAASSSPVPQFLLARHHGREGCETAAYFRFHENVQSREARGIFWARRLAKTFGKRLATNPDLAARALELYSEKLPEKLHEHWCPRMSAEEEREGPPGPMDF